jgi:D-galactarolactone cycloisomerase
MKIVAIEAEQYRITFPGEVRPAWSPGAVWREGTTTVYRVTTDEGITGIGAGQGSPAVVRDRISPRLAGADPFLVDRHFRTILNHGGGVGAYPIACGIEMALWDLIGKAAGLPLYKLWGADKDRVRAYASLVEQRIPEQRADDALELLEAGYRAVKLRLHAPTMREDIAQVEAVRLAVGDQMEIMVDANQAQEPGTPGSESDLVWGYDRALATCREFAPLGVVWMEEPLGRYEFDNLRRLAAASDILIAGGENNIGLHEFRQLIDDECYDVLQPDAAVGLGLSGLRKLAAYAELRHKPVAPHHGGSGVGVAAHLHFSASCANSSYVELLQEPLFLPVETFQGLLADPLLPDSDGYVHLPSGPGLGFELNPALEQVG